MVSLPIGDGRGRLLIGVPLRGYRRFMDAAHSAEMAEMPERAEIAGVARLAEVAEVVAFPSMGGLLADERGDSRFMRIAWHRDAGVVVLSLWQRDRCTGTFRLPIGDVPVLIQLLVDGLAAQTAQLSPSQAPASPPTTVSGFASA